ncbi:VOC family protein [Nocardia concava]|uniref:VOC family protein n=1 Tax=Nocardia concava TaxID=257281 RepID=UPI000307C8C4|nr:VOC family protein [Nocardia concava]
MTKAMCTSVLTIAIPVSDQDRTKELLEALGLKTRLDAELQPGFRWVELELPGGGASLSLVRADSNLPLGIDTGIRLATPDARAVHAALSDLGCRVGELLEWETAPLMFAFTDPDGNRFYVTQDDADR